MHSRYNTNILGQQGNSKAVVEWAKHKKEDVIAAGINQSCSFIDKIDWENARRQTNGVEVSHFKSNSFGRRLSLLAAIQA
jgi:hypothetical protein